MRSIRGRGTRPPGSFTTAEYAAATGLSQCYAGKVIGRAIDGGVLEYAGKIQITDRTGRPYPRCAYRLRTSKR